VSDYGLDDQAIEDRSPARAKDFSSSLCVQTGSGAHPASCTMGTGGPFSGGKARHRRDADHSPHLLPRLRLSRSYTSSPPKRSHGVYRDSFTLLYLRNRNRVIIRLIKRIFKRNEINTFKNKSGNVQNCLLGCTAV
jgi:hypothetical protein